MAEILTTQELVSDPRFKEATESQQGFFLQRHRDQLRGEAQARGVYNEDTEYSINEHIKGYMPKSAKLDALKQGFSEMPETMARSASAMLEVVQGARAEAKDDQIYLEYGKAIQDVIYAREKLERKHADSNDFKRLSMAEEKLKNLEAKRPQLKRELTALKESTKEFKGAKEYLQEDAQTPEAQGLAEISENSLATKAMGALPQAGADMGAMIGLSTFGTPALGYAYAMGRSAGGIAEEITDSEAGKAMTYNQMFNRVSTGSAFSGAIEMAPVGQLTKLKHLGWFKNAKRLDITKNILAKLPKAIKGRVGKSLGVGIIEGTTEVEQGIVEKIASNVGYDQIKLDTILETASQMDDDTAVEFLLGMATGTTLRGGIEFNSYLQETTDKIIKKRAEENNKNMLDKGEPLGDVAPVEEAPAEEAPVDDLADDIASVNETLQDTPKEKPVSLRDEAEAKVTEAITDYAFIRDNNIETKEDLVKSLFETGRFNEIEASLSERITEGDVDVDKLIDKAIDRSIKKNTLKPKDDSGKTLDAYEANVKALDDGEITSEEFDSRKTELLQTREDRLLIDQEADTEAGDAYDANIEALNNKEIDLEEFYVRKRKMDEDKKERDRLRKEDKTPDVTPEVRENIEKYDKQRAKIDKKRQRPTPIKREATEAEPVAESVTEPEAVTEPQAQVVDMPEAKAIALDNYSQLVKDLDSGQIDVKEFYQSKLKLIKDNPDTKEAIRLIDLKRRSDAKATEKTLKVQRSTTPKAQASKDLPKATDTSVKADETQVTETVSEPIVSDTQESPKVEPRTKPIRAPYKNKTRDFATNEGNAVKVESVGDGNYKFTDSQGKEHPVSKTSNDGWVMYGDDAPTGGTIGKNFTEAVDHFATDPAPTKLDDLKSNEVISSYVNKGIPTLKKGTRVEKSKSPKGGGVVIKKEGPKGDARITVKWDNGTQSELSDSMLNLEGESKKLLDAIAPKTETAQAKPKAETKSQPEIVEAKPTANGKFRAPLKNKVLSYFGFPIKNVSKDKFLIKLGNGNLIPIEKTGPNKWVVHNNGGEYKIFDQYPTFDDAVNSLNRQQNNIASLRWSGFNPNQDVLVDNGFITKIDTAEAINTIQEGNKALARFERGIKEAKETGDQSKLRLFQKKKRNMTKEVAEAEVIVKESQDNDVQFSQRRGQSRPEPKTRQPKKKVVDESQVEPRIPNPDTVEQRMEVPYALLKDVSAKRSNLKLRDIISIMEDRLGITIKRGAFRDLAYKATGRYNSKSNVIRTRHANDLQETAHETGHAISERLGLKNLKQTDYNAELEVLGRATSPDHYGRDQLIEEGRAEFFRELMLSDEKAKQMAPNFYDTFHRELAKNPKLERGINDIKKVFKEVVSQDPLERARAGIIEKESKVAKAIKAVDRVISDPLKSGKEGLHALDEFFFDENAPLKRVLISVYGKDAYKKLDPLDNFYILKENSAGVSETANVWIEEGIHDKDGKKLSKSFESMFEGYSPEQYQDASGYLKAKRTLVYYNRGLTNDITYQHALDTIDAYKERYGDPTQLEADVKQWNDALLQLLKDEGSITQTEYDNMVKDFYFPMQRAYADRGYNPFTSVKGDTMDTYDGFMSMQENALKVATRIRQDKINKSVVKASDQKNAGRFIEEVDMPTNDGEEVLSFVQNGKRRYFIVADPNLNNLLSLKSQQSDVAQKAILIWADILLRLPAKMIRYTATINPLFIAKNLAIDAPTASIQTKATFKTSQEGEITDQDIKNAIKGVPFINTVSGLVSLMTNKALTRTYRSSGAGQGTFTHAEVIKGLRSTDKKKSTMARKAVAPIVKMASWMQTLTEITEMAPRMNEFKIVYDQAIAKGQSHDSALESATHASRNVTIDFSRGGYGTKWLNSYTPFFNAGWQGTARMLRTLRTPQGALKFIAYVAMPEALLYLLNMDDEEFNEIPQYERDANWYVPKRFLQMDESESKFFKIPKVRGYSVFTNEIINQIDRMRGVNASEEDSLNLKLLKAGRDEAIGAIPALIKPWVEYNTNYSFFKEKQIMNEYYKDMPIEDQYNDWTSETAKWLGPKLGMPPIKFDHMVNAYTTRYGQTFNSGVNKFVRDDEAEPTQDFNKSVTGNLTGLGTFFASKPSFSARSLVEVTNMSEQIAGLEKVLSRASDKRKESLKAENKYLLSQSRKIKGAYRFLQSNSKKIRKVYDNEDMTPEEKRVAISKLYEQMIIRSRQSLGKPIS